MNGNYTLFYVEANMVCLILFLLMLGKSVRGVDHQAKQRFFNIVLMCHIDYFICDSFWILVLNEFLPKNRLTVSIANLGNAVILSAICCFWFTYVEMDQGAEYIQKKNYRYMIQAPAVILSLFHIIAFLFFPSLMMDENYNMTIFYTISFVLIPITYILAAVVRSFLKVLSSDDPSTKLRCLTIMFYGIGVVVFGIIQTTDLQIPIFCFGCTITMVYMYLTSLDDLVSLDPLTSLNNRAQLNRYVIQELQRSSEDNPHYVVMLDLNDFKSINDKYGHIEGDKALLRSSELIKQVCGKDKNRPFIARYGGDEFILVVKTAEEKDIKELADNLKKAFKEENENNPKDYEFSACVGYAPFEGSYKSFLKAIEEADTNLYEEKSEFYSNRKRSR